MEDSPEDILFDELCDKYVAGTLTEEEGETLLELYWGGTLGED